MDNVRVKVRYATSEEERGGGGGDSRGGYDDRGPPRGYDGAGRGGSFSGAGAIVIFYKQTSALQK